MLVDFGPRPWTRRVCCTERCQNQSVLDTVGHPGLIRLQQVNVRFNENETVLKPCIWRTKPRVGGVEIMGNPFPAVNEEAISDWVGPRSFQLGRSYLEDGAILEPRLQGNTLQASCQGSMYQPYRVWVAYSAEGIEKAHCSCPVGGGGRCKHVGALLAAWLDQPDAFRAVEQPDAKLEQLGKSELIVLIRQMLQVQPNLEVLLEAALPGATGAARRSIRKVAVGR
ncbi:MAG: hypothetical protein F4Y08_01175 [Caldilineaceae bacterium SB0662_bin_9]|uniref:SWIM-type domain-containing protein n=1 Tax=Caldilineaceae bacterium SB0662_bin_9 TaxID=2605258 RepID=A0A6B1DMB2_9CHLR|nr:hypothetical protein [Caldilineaceae bacterium SB0662_bin_9]